MNPEAPVTKTKGFSAIVETVLNTNADHTHTSVDVYDDLKCLNTRVATRMR